jgi:hypothetical protein
MRKILSERNIVVFLFAVTFALFTLAQEDARKAERLSNQLSTLPEKVEPLGKETTATTSVDSSAQLSLLR